MMLERCPEGGKAFDPYWVPDDWSRLQYGRMLWKKPKTRARLLQHWTDKRHPYRDRFLERFQSWVEMVLEADPKHDDALDRKLQKAGHSLRTIIREIPPVFGSFY
ncbi:MAG: hypothetical protein ACI9R3_001652 [Verrucomicrobiales bacterium]|jgi:hypothetical protein